VTGKRERKAEENRTEKRNEEKARKGKNKDDCGETGMTRADSVN
jgi:hypothetical protein